MTRYLYIKIYRDEPMAVRHFHDRSAGLKHIKDEGGLMVDDPDATCLRAPDYGGAWHYLIEVEVF